MPIESNLCLDVNHEGITVPVEAALLRTRGKPTSDCPGSEEDFEITEITFDEDFDAYSFMMKILVLNVPDVASGLKDWRNP